MVDLVQVLLSTNGIWGSFHLVSISHRFGMSNYTSLPSFMMVSYFARLLR